MQLKDYIGEATAYDKKLMLERKDPTSWLKSVSAFANTQGGRLLFGVANDGVLVGLADAQGDAEFISEAIKAQMDLFQRLDLMERRGSGFKKILDAYAFESEKRGETVVPRFESTRTDFFLILPNLNYGRRINGVESSSENSAMDATTEVNTDEIGMKTGGAVNPSVNPSVNPPVNPPLKEVRATLTKSARAVLAALESDSSMTYDKLAAKLKLHRDTIRVSIASLVRMNLLRRIGSDKTGHWEVVK